MVVTGEVREGRFQHPQHKYTAPQMITDGVAGGMMPIFRP